MLVKRADRGRFEPAKDGPPVRGLVAPARREAVAALVADSPTEFARGLLGEGQGDEPPKRRRPGFPL